MGKLLILVGVVLVVVGVLVTYGSKVPFLGWLGRLPGDVRIERPGFSFYLPITTSIVISVVLTLLLRMFGKK